MNSTQKIFFLSTLLVSLVVANGLRAADISNGLIIKPIQAVSFDVGARRAVSYFRNAKGRCKVVLTLAEPISWDNPSNFATSRFEAAVHPGKATRYHSREGIAIEFACLANAQSMSVKAVQLVATGTAQ